MKKIIIVIAIVLTGLGSWYFVNSRTAYSGSMKSVAISYAPFETLALLWTANEQSFFIRNGLDATLHKYNTGAASLDAVLNGKADVAIGTAEFPLVGRAFKKENIRTIGSVDKIQFIYVVARKDRGIKQVSDLKGKRIGTTLGTVAEFYLGRFLELNGMSMQDIDLVDVREPARWINALVNGDIDAIATTQPSVNEMIKQLGTNAIFWSAHNGQPMHALIIATDEWITGHPELVKKLLKSFAQAEKYVVNNPAKAKTIVQKQLNLDASYMDTAWSQNQYRLSLDQSLILTMEEEARWMISNNLTAEKTVPNFLDYIYEDALKKVKPEAVNIIR